MKSKSIKKTLTIKEWLSMESVSFTALCGEKVSHREVIVTMLVCCGLIPAVCAIVYVASWLVGGAA